jgi:RNA polymerase sigma factor (sigma-70 family)
LRRRDFFEVRVVSGTDDTDIGGPRAAFPETPASAVLAARSDDPVARARGFSLLVAAYWKPVYKSIRIRFRKTNEEAKDLTQAFFTHALEREMFRSYDPERARFRAFVRTCLRNYVTNDEEAARRIKRGGGAITLSLDFEQAESEIDRAAPNVAFEDAFDHDLAESLRTMAVEELATSLEARGKRVYFELFERYDLIDPGERPTYSALAEELSLKTTDVTNYLHHARSLLRRIVLRKLREITASEEEFRDEALALLGIEPGEIE